MKQIKNQPALDWNDNDVRFAVENLSEKDQSVFYEKVGESDKDLHTFLIGVFEDNQESIIVFINERIQDAVTKTIENEDD
jgi:hypothetical protein